MHYLTVGVGHHEENDNQKHQSIGQAVQFLPKCWWKITAGNCIVAPHEYFLGPHMQIMEVDNTISGKTHFICCWDSSRNHHDHPRFFVKTIYKNDDALDSPQDLIFEFFVHDKDNVAIHAKS
jgi:hypothetical protein